MATNLAIDDELLEEALKVGGHRTKKATVLGFDRCLGLQLGEWQPLVETIPDDIDALARARVAARQSKNWAESDRLRDEVAALGYAIEDSAGGYRLVRKPA